MNFQKISELCEERKMTIPVLASGIGISEPGLYQVLRNKSMKVDVLENIADMLKAPIWLFFDQDPVTPLNIKIEELKKKISELIEDVEMQKNGIAYSNNKINELERTLELQNNIIQKQSEINETKEQLVIEKEKSIKLYEDMLALYKEVAHTKDTRKAKGKG